MHPTTKESRHHHSPALFFDRPTLARDERDELGHALLHRLLGVLGDLRIRRQGLLHDTRDVCNRQEAVLHIRQAGSGQGADKT